MQCRISSAALGNLAGGWRSSARDLPTEFEAHGELIKAIASEQLDQTSNKETKLVSIFAKHIRTRTAPTSRCLSAATFIVSAELPVNQGLAISEDCNSAAN